MKKIILLVGLGADREADKLVITGAQNFAEPRDLKNYKPKRDMPVIIRNFNPLNSGHWSILKEVQSLVIFKTIPIYATVHSDRKHLSFLSAGTRRFEIKECN